LGYSGIEIGVPQITRTINGVNAGMPRTSYGDEKRSQAWKLVEVLILARNSTESHSTTVKNVQLSAPNWHTAKQPELEVQATLKELASLSSLSIEQVRESLTQHLAEHLGILKDRRSKKAGKGSETWSFVLSLWSTDLDENQKQFDAKWYARKSGNRPNPHQKSSELDQLVREVRDRCSHHVLLTYNHIRLYNLKHIKLDQLFVPVFVSQEPSNQRENRQSPPPEPAMEVINRHQYLLVLGKPGAGKSTFATHLAVACCRDEAVKDWIPILLRCSEFDTRKSFKLIDELEIAFGTEPDITQRILKSGKVLLVLDGLDEVSSQFWQDICQEITNLVKNSYAHKIYVTCRTDLKDDKLPSTFERIEIVDFDKLQQNQFIENWFAIADKDPKSWLTLRLQRQPECTSQILINHIQQNDRLWELAKTPILLSLICLVYISDGKLPEKRSLLYERGLQILLEDWDRDRGNKNRVETEPYKSLSSDNKCKILAELARYTFDQVENTIAFEQTKALEIISQYQNCSRQESLEILEGIAADHGLIFRSAQRTWEFSHLTFQEYFVAQWFAQHQDWETLAPNVRNPRWREIFLLTTEMTSHVDYLIRLIKTKVDLIIKGNYFQKFLNWINKTSDLIETPYKSSAVRAFYIAYEKRFADSLSIKLDSELASDYYFSIYWAEGIEEELGHDMGSYISLKDQLIAEEIKYGIEFQIARAIIFNKSIYKSLQSLKELLSKGTDRNSSFLKKNERRKFMRAVETWLEDLCDVIDVYPDQIHDWEFEDDQGDLYRYYKANKLLVDCLQSENVSVELRQEIEDTLLLPLSELEQRRKPE